MTAKDIDAYIADQPAGVRPCLEALRAIIRSELPQAEERISYQVPTYRMQKNLVGFGATKKGCSFYTMSPPLLASMDAELEGLSYKGSTLHFPPGEPLPEAIIRKIIQARLKEVNG